MEDVINAILNGMSVAYHAHQAREKTDETEHLKNRKVHNRTITEARLQAMQKDDKLRTISKLKESIQSIETVFSDNPLAPVSDVKDELSNCLLRLIGLFGQCNTNISELAEIVTLKMKENENNSEA